MRHIITVALVSVLGSGLALAQEPAAGIAIPDFEDADLNGDEVLGIDEAEVAFSDILPAMQIHDVDMDGILSRMEAENALPGLRFEQSGHENTGSVDHTAYLMIVEEVEKELRIQQELEERPDILPEPEESA